MKREPFVSVVVPTYNRKEQLKECLESLFNQSYPKDKYEIIVVNDGSTDETEDILKQIENETSCNFKWFTQRNKGSYAARNLGIKHAEGDIICFIDDDCIADRYWIENLVKAFDSRDVGGVGGKIIPFRQETWAEKYQSIKMTHEVTIPNMALIMTCNAAYLKRVLLRVKGFDETFKNGGDWDLAIRVRLMGYKLKYVSDAIVIHKHRVTFGDITKQYYKYGLGFGLLCKKYKYLPWRNFLVSNILTLTLDFTLNTLKGLYKRDFVLVKDVTLRNIVRMLYIMGFMKSLFIKYPNPIPYDIPFLDSFIINSNPILRIKKVMRKIL